MYSMCLRKRVLGLSFSCFAEFSIAMTSLSTSLTLFDGSYTFPIPDRPKGKHLDDDRACRKEATPPPLGGWTHLL